MATAVRNASQHDRAGTLTPFLLAFLADPQTQEPLRLGDAVRDSSGDIVEGTLYSTRTSWPIRRGIPRFVELHGLQDSVRSFGDQWNYFNFTQFKRHWIEHTVKHTFGTTDAFRGKLVVDAGGGSGAQTLWMLEAGARHVIMLDLSHSVDDVVQRNLRPSGYQNYDVIQCSIDHPPLRPGSIDGIVICHNVIQHTPDVEKSAAALFSLVGRGEFVFNCYEKNPTGMLRKLRWILYDGVFRRLIPNLPFAGRLAYARTMGILRQVPLLGLLLEKASFCSMGDVPTDSDTAWSRLKARYRATVLNTFDLYGAHRFQHHLTNDELAALVDRLQPDRTKVLNFHSYFGGHRPPGCALRVLKP